jgi:hypothetical protein
MWSGRQPIDAKDRIASLWTLLAPVHHADAAAGLVQNHIALFRHASRLVNAMTGSGDFVAHTATVSYPLRELAVQVPQVRRQREGGKR